MSLDALRDGFVQVCIDTSLNVYAGKKRYLVEGQFTGTGAIEDVPVRVASTRFIDDMFGEGSILAESLKVAFACCPNKAVDIYALPRKDLVAGVAAVYTITFTGNATTAGRVDLFLGDARYNVSVNIEVGDTPTNIAAKVVAAISHKFPYTAIAALGVVTLTARNKGTVGNYLNVQYNWHNRQNYAPAGVTVAVVRTTPGSGDPLPADYATILQECCYSVIALLTGNVDAQDALVEYIKATWDCATPQCFGHGYTYNAGTLGEILATFTDSPEISRMAHCDDDPNFPWFKVAAYSAKSACSTVDNPELSIQGSVYGVLDCILAPASCEQCFTFDEQEQLRESAFVVTVPVVGGTGGLTSPMVTNDVTNNLYDEEGNPNATFRDVNSRRLAAVTAEELAIEVQRFNGLGLYTKNTNIRAGIKGTNPRLMLGDLRVWAKLNVGVLFSEFEDLDKDLTLKTSFEVDPKCQGVPGKLYLNLVYRPPVRISKIVALLQPKLLDNCR
jgi:phage tail sheath gpL-like